MSNIFDRIVGRFSRKKPNILHEVDVPFKKATFGMGYQYWFNEALFGAVQGVIRTRVGYSGGTTLTPTDNNIGDHTEVVEIDFDPIVVSYEDLLDVFLSAHEYLLSMTDVPLRREYISLILYHDTDQKNIAEYTLRNEEKKRNVKLSTEIAPAGAFYPGEEYRQKSEVRKHPMLCKELGLGLGSELNLFQTSHAAARLNGYVLGMGKPEDLEKDIVKLGISKKAAKYLRKGFKKWKKVYD